MKPIEIDPRRTRRAQWRGLYQRGITLAEAVVAVVASRSDFASCGTRSVDRPS